MAINILKVLKDFARILAFLSNFVCFLREGIEKHHAQYISVTFPQHDRVRTTNKKSHTQNSFKIHF